MLAYHEMSSLGERVQSCLLKPASIKQSSQCVGANHDWYSPQLIPNIALAFPKVGARVSTYCFKPVGIVLTKIQRLRDLEMFHTIISLSWWPLCCVQQSQSWDTLDYHLYQLAESVSDSSLPCRHSWCFFASNIWLIAPWHGEQPSPSLNSA